MMQGNRIEAKEPDMGSSITYFENRITVNEENFTTYTAVQLMQEIVDIYSSRNVRLILDLNSVEDFSQSGLLILQRLMEEFKSLRLEGAPLSLSRDTKKYLVHRATNVNRPVA